MGQLGVVITQRHWAEVFLEEVQISASVNINSLERDGLCQAELCPRNTMMMNTNRLAGELERTRAISRYGWNIVGLCEMRWKNFGEMSTDYGPKVIFCGKENRRE